MDSRLHFLQYPGKLTILVLSKYFSILGNPQFGHLYQYSCFILSTIFIHLYKNICLLSFPLYTMFLVFATKIIEILTISFLNTVICRLLRRHICPALFFICLPCLCTFIISCPVIIADAVIFFGHFIFFAKLLICFDFISYLLLNRFCIHIEFLHCFSFPFQRTDSALHSTLLLRHRIIIILLSVNCYRSWFRIIIRKF